VKVAVLPLIKKDGLPEKARAIIDGLKLDHNCQYDEKDSIGKRYRRQDAIGTPYCITVDHDTMTNDMKRCPPSATATPCSRSAWRSAISIAS
jgi:glycyl-tRNA synthetase